MQIFIDIPDNLTRERVNQIIEELEQKLQTEAQLIASQPKLRQRVYAHLIDVDKIDLPARDELY
ncbi:MAG: hypothetical protein WBM32_04965 [Crocosphaera sp.]